MVSRISYLHQPDVVYKNSRTESSTHETEFDHFSFTIGQKSKLSLAGSLKPRCQTGEENPRARLNLSE